MANPGKYFRCFLPFLAYGVALAATDVPAGAHVLLRMVNSISTRTAQEGDYVYLRTATPISANGRIVVPADCYVQGVVARSKRSGRIKGRSELGIRLETLTMPGGKVLKFSPRVQSADDNESEQKVDREENMVRQGGNTMKDAGRIAILAGSGASIGGIADHSWKGAGIGAGAGSAAGLATVLLTRGREVELKQGSSLDVVFDRGLSLE